MATELQTKTLEAVVELGRTGKRIVKRRVLKKVGYSQVVADQPKKVFESKGFLELCDEIGLTDTFLTQALYEDIKAKKGKRKPELELAFKVKGRLKEENNGQKTQNNIFVITDEQQRAIARRIITGDQPSEEQNS